MEDWRHIEGKLNPADLPASKEGLEPVLLGPFPALLGPESRELLRAKRLFSPIKGMGS